MAQEDNVEALAWTLAYLDLERSLALHWKRSLSGNNALGPPKMIEKDNKTT